MIGILLFIVTGAVVYDRLQAPHRISPDALNAQKSQPLDPSAWLPVPDVSLKSIDGKNVSLNDLKGRVVILNFWATWCPSCSEEFPSMLKLVRKFKGKVVLVAVSIDENKVDIENFINGLKTEFPEELAGSSVQIAWDVNRTVTSDVFQTMRFPEAIILSKDLRMARKVVGAFNWESKEISDYIDKLLVL